MLECHTDCSCSALQALMQKCNQDIFYFSNVGAFNTFLQKVDYAFGVPKVKSACESGK